MMSLGFQTAALKNPNNCNDAYAPSFWLGKPGALTQIRMPNAGWPRALSDNFAVHNLLDGQSVDRSPYGCRVWQFTHEWLTPDVMSVFMEYATRQRGVGPFILIDPQMKNLLTPNQASGTDALHTSEGFSVDAATIVTALDTFTRTVTGSWGTEPVSAQAWAASAAASAMSVTGTQGQISTGTVNQLYFNTINSGVPNGSTDHNVSVQITLPVVPTGASITLRVVGRWTDSQNFYEAQVAVGTTGVATLLIQKRVLNTPSSVTSSTSIGTHNAGDTWQIVLDVQGTTLKAKAWNVTTGSDPGAYQLTGTDSSLTTGTQFGAGVRRETSNSNGTVNVLFDNFIGTTYTTNSLGSSTDDVIQGERALSWTMSPPVTGANTTMYVDAQTGLYGFCLPPTATSAKKFAFSGYVKLGSTSLDSSAQVTPTVVFMNGVGAVQSTLSGATVTAVTGTAGTGWQAFCVTGSVPSGQSGVYLEPRFQAVNSTITAQTVFLFDQLQLEIIDGTTCTTWEYGQGQPLVSVRNDGESVPRILRTSMSYVAVEVT
jgi:hypothetical protein